jgi:MFS transporter, DHA3 family, macrolide efflux protein
MADDSYAPRVEPALTETNPEVSSGPRRLWNSSFLLLWQGQLVSAVGDAFYSIALGFWVLAETGSTALMGTLMAASTLPRVIIAPFAGVLVDRSERKALIVWMDAVRGLAVVAVAMAAYAGLLQVWMVFAAGIVISIGGAFFGPAVSSATPDIVPKDRLIKANSAFNLIYTGSGVLGSSAGGFLYQALGAPLLFLLNGISYLVAAVASLFIRVPKVEHARQEFHFLSDLKDGVAFVWRCRGIRYSIALFSVVNFFAVMGLMLFLPLFQRTPHLGAGLYGIFIACFTGGLSAGFLFTSFFHVPYPRRFAVFYISGIVMMLLSALVPVWLYFPAMLGCVVIAGLANAVLNSFISATLQVATPQDLRGKVFSLLGTVSGGLTPLAMALGGVLAEFIPIRIVIASAFILTLLSFLPLVFSRPVRALLNFNPEQDTAEAFR